MFNRKGVIDSLKNVKHVLNIQRNHCPEKGLIIYSGNNQVWVIDDTQLPSNTIYECSNVFNTSVLKSVIDCSNGPLYGFVIIDGDDTLFATVQGNVGNEHVEIIKSKSSFIRGRCRRGGQSALRFDRLRDEAEDKYVQTSVENIGCLKDCDSIIIAGKANLKNLFASKINLNVLGLLNISVGSEAGLYEAIPKSKELRDKFENKIEYSAIELFEIQLVNDPDLLVFGIPELIEMVGYGIVKTVIISKRLKPKLIERIKKLSDQFGTEVLEIKGITASGDSFCTNYRTVGVLRYKY